MEQVLNAVKHIDFERLAIGLLVLIACLAVSRLLIRLFDKIINKSRHIEASLHSVLKTMLRIVLYFVSIMFAANSVGIPITSFLALFSVVGLAVSLAVQGVLSNLAGGVIILASKPFTLGDFIETDAISGTVHEIGFLHTHMISPDGKMIFVPNSLLHNSRLINYSSTGTRRIDLQLNLNFQYAPEDVRRAAMQAVKSIDTILLDPAPQVLVESYGDSSILYIVRVWCPSGEYLTTRYSLNEALYAAIRESGIEFTYPHMHVHMQ